MTDLEFVQKCVKGDKLAWDEFIERYSRLIYNYIYQILTSRFSNQFDQNDPEDIFQGIFLLLHKDNFKKLRSFQAKNNCSLGSWLRQITVNYTIDHIRRIKPDISFEEEGDQGLSLKDILRDFSISPEEKMLKEEKLLNLTDCISQLGTDEKFFLELYLARHYRIEDLSKILHISRGAVDMRKSRIIESLKECFKRKDFL